MSNNYHAIPGNYSDLDYSGMHADISVYQYEGEYYWISLDDNSDPIGPFDTSADAYHDAQGF